MTSAHITHSNQAKPSCTIAALVLTTLMLVVAAIPVATAQTYFSEASLPVRFVSGQLFSGVGHGDRIPGAAGVITLAVGDFNNDSKLDLITTNSDVNDNGLGLVLGNGDGTFQTPIDVAGFYSYGSMGGIVAGDFNHDGNLDFAAMWLLGGPVQVGVYLGDGQGHFPFNNSYSIGTTLTRSLAAADVNGDGKLDLIAPDPSNSAVAVLYGNGDGTFQNAVDFPAAVAGVTAPTGVAVGDFNKDTKPDIVVASSTGCCPLGGGISVLLNSGAGSFLPPVLYSNPSGVDAGQVAIADLNADGQLDVAETSMGGQNVAVFLSNGDGTFQNAKNFTVYWPSSLAIGNLNGDKKPELVVTSYYDGTVWMLLNKGGGIFQVSSVYSSDWSARSIALADFNRDQKLDFVTGNSNGQFVTLGLGNGDGTFRDSLHYNESGAWTTGIAVADFNVDGNPDVIQAGGGTGVGLSLMLGTSHGMLGAPTFIDLGGSPYSTVAFVLAGDVNGDGKPDIVSSTAEGYGNPYGVVVMLGLGPGQSATYNTSPSSYPAYGLLADVNRDGRLDILTSNFDASLSVLLNTGHGSYGAPIVVPGVTADASWMAVGDFNLDGKPDLVLSDWGAVKTVLLLGNGDGTFQSPTVINSSLRPTGAAIVGDYNKDGKLDLAILAYDSGGTMGILLGNGNGTFSTGATYYFIPQDGYHAGQFLPSGTAADLNADGNLDIAIAPSVPAYQVCGGYRCAEQYMGALVFLGNGDSTFVQQSGWLAGVYPAYLGVGDFNRDGMADLAYVSNNLNYGQTSVTILQNATQPVSVSPLSIKYPATPVGEGNTQTVLLTNNQATFLAISNSRSPLGGANPPDFSVAWGCGSRLSPGAYCTIAVTFAPIVVGSRTATLFITDSAGVQSVQLSGVGK